MNRKVLFLLTLIFCTAGLSAQELNCRIQINSDKIQGTNKQVYTTLQTALTEFMNNKKWTNAQFTNIEKVDCSFVITVNEENTDTHRYKCELQVQSRRPVFNSVYSTTLLNFRDVSFDFNYVEFDPLQFSENKFDGNLTAVMAFYAYIILGIDQDSFSPLGGTPYFHRAEQIMNQAQSNMETGWQAFDNQRNRYAVISSFLDEASKGYRLMWYTYHRKGLDEMCVNTDKSRATMGESLSVLKTLYSDRPRSVLLTLFSDAKIDEVNDIFAKGLPAEKESVYKVMSDVFPAQSNRYESIRK